MIDGRYGWLEEIGAGGSGKVYLAQVPTGRHWAIKELSALGARTEQVRELFDQAQKILSWLPHPAIVRRREVLTEGDSVFPVMEHVPGMTLRELLRRLPRPFPVAAAVELAEQIAEVLAYLHSQKPYPVIFRDLKPGNLMVPSS